MGIFDSIENGIEKFTPGGGMMHSFLHPEEGYQEAQKATEKGWNEAKGFGTPYWQHGLDTYEGLKKAFESLLNPEKLENDWASGYEKSPYARQELAENQENGLNAASSMGLMGSSGALGNIQKGAGNIVAADRQNYLRDIMEKYMQGIGLGGNIYGTGASMGAHLGDLATRAGENQAGLRFGAKNAPGELLGHLLGGATSAASNMAAPGSGSLMGNTNQFNVGGG